MEKADTTDSDPLRAITLLFDRVGLNPKTEISIEAKPYETLMGGIYKVMPQEALEAAQQHEADQDDEPLDAIVVADPEPDGRSIVPIDNAPSRRVGTKEPPPHLRRPDGA